MTKTGRYIFVETSIAVAFSALVTLVIFSALFHDRFVIASRDMAADAIPQTFMIVLMNSLIPTVLTRRRVARSSIAAQSATPLKLPRNVWARSLTVAIPLCVLSAGLHYLLLPLITPSNWGYFPSLIYKVAFAAVLAAAVTPWIVRAALADPYPAS